MALTKRMPSRSEASLEQFWGVFLDESDRLDVYFSHDLERNELFFRKPQHHPRYVTEPLYVFSHTK